MGTQLFLLPYSKEMPEGQFWKIITFEDLKAACRSSENIRTGAKIFGTSPWC